MMETSAPNVLRLSDIDPKLVQQLLNKFGLKLIQSAAQQSIPGSFWGDEEAGLKANNLYAREDTPLHSILHEACHYICMDVSRRAKLDTDAGSNIAEENAVCYLQILLADELAGLGQERMFSDMDAWGYSFRLGCSQKWFEQDAQDARAWLVDQGLIDNQARPLFCLRKL